ncbi:hypothetical protein Glove_117g25 [Diversispora epigaea]|uniref:mRNA cap guanine-N(7) methyltransferase n=1 Tax=Diversispora epigaea TaxID=1348612 RepID=A0A397J2M6_9GLOM|nr:hypothetical protein Glove_117g25 [Diversispora epigaea]
MSYPHKSNTSSSSFKRKPDEFDENLSSNKSRKTSAGATPQHVVAEHYNSIEDKGKQRRLESKIIFLRNFNNWVKSVLIGINTPERGVILDIGCGKGGDLLKWGKAKISKLVGLDIAEVSINDAKNRFGKIDQKFDAEFHVFDCFSKRISMIESIKNIKFDVVSMQFCIHYSFETEEKAKMALQNISSNLKKGGSFIGTVPDAYWIVKKLKSLGPDQLEFGNSIYSIRFEQKNDFPTFGHKYWFNLEDAINDCPEYLVHFPTFKRMASEYGLELKYLDRFHDMYDKMKEKRQHRDLLYKMGVIRHKKQPGVMSQDEWEAAGIYKVFEFTKVR